MKLGIGNGKYCISLIFLVLTPLINNVSGGILEPPLEAIGENDVELISVSGNTLTVVETLIPVPADGPIRLAKILHDGGADPINFGGNPPPMVSIERDGVDAYLVLNSPLDFETVPQYNFVITQVLPKPLVLTVKDINDNPPVFDSDTCTSKEVLENEDPGLLLCTFHATDKDAIDLGALRYSFEESLPGGKELFSLGDENGRFELIGELNYIESPMYRFEVTVKDSDDIHPVSTIFTISIKDVPNLPPVLSQFQPFVTVPEGSTDGDFIQTIKATDGDIQVKCPLEYTIVFNNTALSRFFDLGKDSGILTVKEEIDATQIFSLNGGLVINAVVTVTEKNDRTAWPDIGKYPDMELESLLQINIEDKNTHSPEFCFSASDCDSANEISIVTDENVLGSLPLATGSIFVRDLDPTQQFSTFDVTLEEASEAERYVVQALSISPASGFFGTSFSISTISSDALDYEDNTGFDETTEGKWWRKNDADVPEPKPVRFIIKATDNNDPTKFARKEVTLTVRDKNDNPPVHPPPVEQAEYTFAVCEDVGDGIVLKRKNYDPIYPVCTEEDGEDIHFDAVDADISHIFGTPSIEYVWFSKEPPLELDKDTGEMTVKWPTGSTGVFDFERYTEEIFTVQAIDEKLTPESRTRQRSTAVVKFVILDVNDTPVDLKLNASRIEIEENTENVAFPVTIEAVDEDLEGCIQFELRVDSTTGNTELDAKIAQWFKIVELDGEETLPCKNDRKARIELGDSEDLIDREGYDSGVEVDRVDVSVIAKDIKTKTGNPQTEFRLTIDIKDKNDNPPEFQDYEETDPITFTESFGIDFGEDGDTASPYEREIIAFRATDRDRNSQFSFTLSSPYPLMEELVDLESFSNGRAILRREQGKIIDRENANFYGAGKNDTLHYVITVSDTENENHINVYIKIDDLNDNEPKFQNLVKEFSITEGTAKPLIETFRATDDDRPDRYGNVSYFLLPGTDSDPEPVPTFSIGIQSGIFGVGDSTQWHEISEYKIKVEAVDYYRPSSSSSSNRVNYDITVKVIDVNDHDPRFITSQSGTWNEIKETEFNEGDRRFENFIEIEDLDDISLGNGDFSVRITKVECVPPREGVDPSSFFDPVLEIEDTKVKPSTKKVFLKATKSFENYWGIYTIHFEAEDKPASGTPRKTPGVYQIIVESENLHSPKFGYPIDNNTKLYISYLAPVGPGPIEDYYGNALLPITVTDEDDPSTGNGEIVSVALDATSATYFNLIRKPEIDAYELQKRATFPDERWLHTVIITATDGGTPSNSMEAHLTIQIVPNSNSPPEFKDEDKPFNKEIMENDPDWGIDIPVAEDLDLIVGITPDIIYYHFAGGAVDYFNLEIRLVDGVNVSRLSLKAPLDREELDQHKVVIWVSNNPEPPETPVDPENVDPNDKSYLVVEITVLDELDCAPEFAIKGVIVAGISVRKQINDFVVTIKATDADLNPPDDVTYTLSDATASHVSLQNVLPRPFRIDTVTGSPDDKNKVASLFLTFTSTLSMEGYFTFTITATDTVGMSSTADCKFYMIEDKHIVTFVLDNEFDDVDTRTELLADILTTVFGFRCNIDSVSHDGVNNVVMVNTHFIDLEKNLPVVGDTIEKMQFDPVVLRNLRASLAAEGFIYRNVGTQNSKDGDSEENLVTYFLIAGVAILGLILLVSSIMWFFNNRSLTRRVRALNATAFGSQQSGLNRAGATTLELPNTNAHAIQGSNPIWTTQNDRKMPDFDTESIGSGGSVLIGAEDEDYFRNYQGTKGGMGMSNPLFNMNVEDTGNDFGSAMYSDSSSESGPPPPQYSTINNDNDEYLDIPMPTVTRRNPLMNFDMHMDDSDS